jgi:phosphohistidine phosphatase SixA
MQKYMNQEVQILADERLLLGQSSNIMNLYEEVLNSGKRIMFVSHLPNFVGFWKELTGMEGNL